MPASSLLPSTTQATARRRRRRTTHDHRRQLAVLVEDPEVERLRILLAELEDVAHLDAARTLEDVVTVRTGSPKRTSAASIVPSPVKSRPDEVDDVAPGSFEPVTHRVPSEIVGRAGSGCPSCPRSRAHRPDVALDEPEVLGERLLVEGLDLGRLDLGTEPLLVDVAVAGQADGERLARAVGVRTSMTTTFFSVSPAVHAVLPGCSLRWATRVSIVGVSGVSSAWAAGTPSHPTGSGAGTRPPRRWRHSRSCAADVGVLAHLGGGEELLALGPAHRTGHRLDDDVVNPSRSKIRT